MTIPKGKTPVADFLDYAINLEVHVVGWGPSAFFTVRAIHGTTAILSTRYTGRVKFPVAVSRLYFTTPCAEAAKRRKYASEKIGGPQ